MNINKKVINYYNSFYEVSKDLNQKQFYDFNMAIFKVMFFEQNIDEVEFEDRMLSILWKSVKHSIDASIKGFCDKKNIAYEDIFTPLTNPLTNPLSNNEKGKEKENDKVEFSFTLKTQKLLSSTSKEYKEKLEDYIKSNYGGISYEDFYEQCEMKPYKYKNFQLAYNNWCKKNFNAYNKSKTINPYEQVNQFQLEPNKYYKGNSTPKGTMPDGYMFEEVMVDNGNIIGWKIVERR